MTVRLEDFGIIGDGTTDNSTSFLVMRDRLLAKDPLRRWRIGCDGGKYRYQAPANRMFNGFRHVDFDLNGGELVFDGDGATVPGGYMAITPDPFLGVNDNTHSGAPTNQGSRFASSLPGAKTVNLLMAGEAAKYTVGEPVLVCAHDAQRFGYPPAFQFFEHNVIESVDIGANTASFKYSLRHNYLNSFPDRLLGGAVSVGAARVFKLVNRKAYISDNAPDMIENFAIRNGVVRSIKSSRFGVSCANNFKAENVRFDVGVYVLTAKEAVFANCECPDHEVEIDKNIGSVRFVDGDYKKIRGGIACDVITLSGNVKIREDFSPAAKTVDISGWTNGPMGDSPGNIGLRLNTPTESLRVRSSRLYTARNSLGQYDGFVGLEAAFSGDKKKVSAVNGSDVTFADANLRVGAYIMRIDGAVYGRVKAVTGANSYRVRWSTAGLVANADEFYILPAAVIDYDDTVWSPSGWPAIMPNPYTGVLAVKGPSVSDLVIDSFAVHTKLSKISVNVIRAGISTSGVLIRGFGGSPSIMSVKCNNPGLREITPAGATGAVGSDNLNNFAELATYRPAYRLDIGGFGADETLWPLFEITFTAEPLIRL